MLSILLTIGLLFARPAQANDFSYMDSYEQLVEFELGESTDVSSYIEKLDNLEDINRLPIEYDFPHFTDNTFNLASAINQQLEQNSRRKQDDHLGKKYFIAVRFSIDALTAKDFCSKQIPINKSMLQNVLTHFEDNKLSYSQHPNYELELVGKKKDVYRAAISYDHIPEQKSHKINAGPVVKNKSSIFMEMISAEAKCVDSSNGKTEVFAVSLITSGSWLVSLAMHFESARNKAARISYNMFANLVKETDRQYIQSAKVE